MRAMLLHNPAPPEQDPLRLEEVEDPQPGSGEIGLRVLACGVCHTDLHIVRGELPPVRRPIIPGHQIVGVVEALGAGVDTALMGARVGVPWLSSACGDCDRCAAGRENLCEQARFTGYHVNGGFAERAVVPAAAAHPLPAGYDDLAAAPLLCAGVIGYRALRVSGIQPGQRLGLYGFGASAHIAIQVAVHQGCEVFVFTRSEAHRRLARDLGASWTGAAADEPPARCQAAITFAPAGWLVREALRVLDRGGTVAINAIHMNAVPELDYATHLYWERGIRSVANATHRDARDFLALAGEIPLRTTVQGVPLASANEVLRRLARSELDAAAALVPTAG